MSLQGQHVHPAVKVVGVIVLVLGLLGTGYACWQLILYGFSAFSESAFFMKLFGIVCLAYGILIPVVLYGIVIYGLIYLIRNRMQKGFA